MLTAYYKVPAPRYVGGSVGWVTPGSSAYQVAAPRYVGGSVGWVIPGSSASA